MTQPPLRQRGLATIRGLCHRAANGGGNRRVARRAYVPNHALQNGEVRRAFDAHVERLGQTVHRAAQGETRAIPRQVKRAHGQHIVTESKAEGGAGAVGLDGIGELEVEQTQVRLVDGEIHAEVRQIRRLPADTHGTAHHRPCIWRESGCGKPQEGIDGGFAEPQRRLHIVVVIHRDAPGAGDRQTVGGHIETIDIHKVLLDHHVRCRLTDTFFPPEEIDDPAIPLVSGTLVAAAAPHLEGQQARQIRIGHGKTHE